MDKVHELLVDMTSKNLLPTAFTFNAIINKLCSRGDIQSANNMLEGMLAWGLKPNVVIYTTVINGYVKELNFEVAAKLFKEMTVKGISPDVFYYSSLIIGLWAGRKGVKGAQPGPVLSWAERVKIAVGATKGLEYLHEKTKPRIIHRDIKSSNVLLFENDVAKIADFDLSNQAPDASARLHSTRVLGTFGYHAQHLQLIERSIKEADIFIFPCFWMLGIQ